jgi:HK97 family phage portal protein
MSFFTKLENRKYEPTQPSVSRRFFFGTKNLNIDDDIAMTAAAFNRGVLYLATQLAKLPWNIKKSDKTIEPNSRIANILNRNPNPETTAFILRVSLLIDAIVTGNGYWEIEREASGRIKNLWNIPSRDVQPWRDTDGKLWYRVTGGSAMNARNGVLLMRPDEIYHLRGFHTKDSISGMGVTDYAGETLAISVGADKFASSLFANGGMPSGVITVPGKISEQAIGRMKESWDAATTGRKTATTAILEEGTTYSPISLAPDVMQFIETRKFGVPEIARFLGVPPTKLYDLTQSTYNNVEQENIAVANDTLDPWARNIENEADKKFLGNDFTRHTELDLFQVFRGDMETRSKFYNTLFGMGSIQPNEIRTLEGWAKYDGGDRYYVAANNFTPIDKVDDVIDSNISKNNQAPSSSEDDLNNEAIAFLKKNG